MLNKIDVVNYTEIVKCINSHCHLRDIDLEHFTTIIMEYLYKMIQYPSNDSNILKFDPRSNCIEYSWVTYTNLIFAFYKKYIVDNSDTLTNEFIKAFYNTYIKEKGSDINSKIYSYIFSKFIDMNINSWLTKEMCDLFAKFYEAINGSYTYWYFDSTNNITEKVITEINSMTDIKNMKKLSDCNPKEMITYLLPSLDIVLCRGLFGDFREYNPRNSFIRYKTSSEYTKEKQYSSCARMEKNWIDYNGVNCKTRNEQFYAMKEYHEWSKQYIEFPNDPNEQLIGLYPQHVMNFILYQKLYKKPISIDNDEDEEDDEDED